MREERGGRREEGGGRKEGGGGRREEGGIGGWVHLTKLMWTPRPRCTPLHSRHMKVP